MGSIYHKDQGNVGNYTGFMDPSWELLKTPHVWSIFRAHGFVPHLLGIHPKKLKCHEDRRLGNLRPGHEIFVAVGPLCPDFLGSHHEKYLEGSFQLVSAK